jgi:hypothetical protein
MWWPFRRTGAVVYTALFGGYDELPAQPRVPGVPFVCFTDDRRLRAAGWDIRVRRPRHPHPRMAAKWYKLLAHRALPGVRHAIWIDACVRLCAPRSVDRLLAALGPSGLALCRHPDRDNIYDEAEASLTLAKYDGLPIREQVEAYGREGLPDSHGLWAGTVLVRDLSRPEIRRLGRWWMRENLRWTYQDQLSLPYVLWRLDIAPDPLPFPLWDNDVFVRDITARPHPDR